jgi:hypothetical protein
MQADGMIKAGTVVQVRNRFTGAWCVGFEVAGRSDEVFHLRRLRDGAILPATFRHDEIRVCVSDQPA